MNRQLETEANMKKVLIGGLMVGLLAITLAFALMSRQAQGAATDKTQTADKKSTEPQDESSFWDLFRKTFSRPEPDYKQSDRNVTTVAGVRGVNNEGKLGNQSDLASVKWMEDYKLPDEKVMDFLKSRSLGPYKSSGGGK
jgi:hypothetical protein